MKHLPKSPKGVPSIDPEPADAEACDGCAFGKSHHLPFPPSEKHASKPLELVHMDEDRPMRT